MFPVGNDTIMLSNNVERRTAETYKLRWGASKEEHNSQHNTPTGSRRNSPNRRRSNSITNQSKKSPTRRNSITRPNRRNSFGKNKPRPAPEIPQLKLDFTR